MSSNANTSITFLLQFKPLFQLNLQSQTNVTIKQLLYHIIKTISIDIKINPEPFFMNGINKTLFVYSNQQLSNQISINDSISNYQKLFYNLNKQQYQMLLNQQFEKDLRIIKPMKSDHMKRKYKKQFPIQQPISQQQKLTQTKKTTKIELQQSQINKNSQNQSNNQIKQQVKKKQQPQQTYSTIKVQIQLTKISEPKESQPVHNQNKYFRQKLIPISNKNIPNPQNEKSMCKQKQNKYQYKLGEPIPEQQQQQNMIQQRELQSQKVQSVNNQTCCQII